MNTKNFQSEFLRSLSEGMIETVEAVSALTVLVNARKRMSVSGILVGGGNILTVDHGIEFEDHIQVMLPDGETAQAVLVGRDPGTDLAVLKIDAVSGERRLQAAEKPARVGQPVIALGKPEPEGVQASFGIVVALGQGLRTMRGSVLERYIATDATPYPGFSGGPLVSLNGEIVGINTSGLVGGTSLAIPVQIAMGVMGQLVAHGKVKRGFLGIRSQVVELAESIVQKENLSQKHGLLVVGMETGKPADQGGILVGDILVELGGKPTEDQDELFSALSSDVAGKQTEVKVLRGGNLLSLHFMIGEKD